MNYIIPEIVQYIPDELKTNYPIQLDRDNLDKYIRLALIYSSPTTIRFTLTANKLLCDKVINLKYDGSIFKKDTIDEYTARTLDNLEDIVKPKVALYFKLNKFLQRAIVAVNSLDSMSEATKLFMLNFLVDYQSLNPILVLNNFPRLPEEIYPYLILHDSILDKDLTKEIYIRLQENFDDFLETWYLYKGLNLL